MINSYVFEDDLPEITGRFIFNARGVNGSSTFVDDSGNYSVSIDGSPQIATIGTTKVVAMGDHGRLLVPADVFNLRTNNRQQTTIKVRMYTGTPTNDRYVVFFDSRYLYTWPGMVLYFDTALNSLILGKREDSVISHNVNLGNNFHEVALYISNLTDGYADVVMRLDGITVYSGNIYTKIIYNTAFDMLDTGVYTYNPNVIGGACDAYHNTYLMGLGVWDSITDETDYTPDFSKQFS
jgi:hypothetical protein